MSPENNNKKNNIPTHPMTMSLKRLVKTSTIIFFQIQIWQRWIRFVTWPQWIALYWTVRSIKLAGHCRTANETDEVNSQAISVSNLNWLMISYYLFRYIGFTATKGTSVKFGAQCILQEEFTLPGTPSLQEQNLEAVQQPPQILDQFRMSGNQPFTRRNGQQACFTWMHIAQIAYIQIYIVFPFSWMAWIPPLLRILLQ